MFITLKFDFLTNGFGIFIGTDILLGYLFIDKNVALALWKKKAELHKMGNVSSGVNLGFLRCFGIYRAEIKFPTSSLGPWLMPPIGRYRVSLEKPHRKFFRRF